jgi:AAA domain/Bifunctional DNA primase/polymerase, N-terminal/Primase C terminal 2 (PriCT-2)
VTGPLTRVPPAEAISREEVRAFRKRAIANGYRLVRVRSGLKAPLPREWQDGDRPEFLLNARPDALNTGLVLGGLRCVDIDVDDPQLISEIRELARLHLPPGALLRCRANSPRVAMLYRAAEGQPCKRVAAGLKDKVEVLGAGQQVVVHGLHPSGAALTWSDGRGPDTVSVSDIPAVSEDQITAFLEACAPLLGATTTSGASVRGASTAQPPVDVPDAFKVVPDHLKGQKATNELSRPPLTEAEFDALLAKIPSAGLGWDEWNNVGIEIYASCKGADYGLDAWERWLKTDPVYATQATGCEDAWKRFHNSPPTRTGAGALINKARSILAGSVGVPAAPQQSSVAHTTATSQLGVTPLATGSVWDGMDDTSLSNIPPREWLYGIDLVRGKVTVVASPGGVGKSSLVLGMMVALVTEKTLLGETIWDANHKAIYLNGEDDQKEMRRRLAAFCSKHNIAEQDYHGKLLIAGNDKWQAQCLQLLRIERQTSHLNEDGFAHLESLLAPGGVSALVIDPLVKFIVGNVNDKAAMGQVVGKLAELAAKYHCAIVIVHHTKKGSDLDNQEAVSGAAAIVNLSRRTIATIPMSLAEANEVGVLPSERGRYFRVVATKTNMSPPSAHAGTNWYELCEVSLNNGNSIYKRGDKVQAVVRAALSPAQRQQLTMEDKIIRRAILDVVDKGKAIGGQSHPYSPNVTGANNHRAILDDAMVAISQATPHHQWHPGDLQAVVSRSIKRMLAEGWLLDELIEKGRFRGCRGLKVDWPRTLWPDRGDGAAGGEDDQDMADETAGDCPGQLRNEVSNDCPIAQAVGVGQCAPFRGHCPTAPPH